MECSEEDLEAHNEEVDSSDEVLSLLKILGVNISATSYKNRTGKGKAVPGYGTNEKQDFCLFSDDPSRPLSTFDCSQKPFPLKENKQRICWCKAGKTINTVIPLKIITQNNYIPFTIITSYLSSSYFVIKSFLANDDKPKRFSRPPNYDDVEKILGINFSDDRNPDSFKTKHNEGKTYEFLFFSILYFIC